MRSSTLPARVSQSRSRYPLRWLRRSALRSPCPAPHRASLSNSIRRWAAKPIISRRNVASEPFSRSVRRAILSSVIVVILRSELRVATQRYSGSPRWPLTGPPASDSWRSLRRAGQRPPTPSPGTRHDDVAREVELDVVDAVLNLLADRLDPPIGAVDLQRMTRGQEVPARGRQEMTAGKKPGPEVLSGVEGPLPGDIHKGMGAGAAH